MAKKVYFYVPAVIFVMLIAFLFIYLILVHPTERARMLTDEKTVGVTIIMQNNEFSPEELEVSIGTRVTWINRDNVKHRVSGAEFKSGILNPGQTYSYRFNRLGIFEYSCEFEPGMTGRIIVK